MPTTRRSFLVAAGASAAASTLPGSAATAFAANDTLAVGVIGCGGRARHLLKALNKLSGVRVTALADVWSKALSETAPFAVAGHSTTGDYAELLADKRVDAVLIATPDHQHVPCTLAALKAGKDVYVEKPLTHDESEGAVVLKAAADAKRVVQVGTQQRSMPHVVKARDMVRAGAIGKPVKVGMSWNRNSDRVKRFPLGVDPKSVDWKGFLGAAKDQPFDEYCFRNWRWFWDFGGGIFTDLMVHWVDVAHYLLDLSAPTEAVALGQFVTAAGVWETPDTVQTVLKYPGGVQMHFEGTFSNARRGAHIEFHGADATLYVDRGRYELIPERGRKLAARQEVVGTGLPGADFYDKPDGERLHLQNWLDCIRSRRAPNSPAESGVGSAVAAHLANQSLRAGGVADWK